MFFTTGGLVATGKLGAFAWRAVNAGSRHARPVLGIGGRAIGSFSMTADNTILGAGLMGAGVPWTTYESQRVTAAAHKTMAGRGGSTSWQDFVPFWASAKAFGGIVHCW